MGFWEILLFDYFEEQKLITFTIVIDAKEVLKFKHGGREAEAPNSSF